MVLFTQQDMTSFYRSSSVYLSLYLFIYYLSTYLLPIFRSSIYAQMHRREWKDMHQIAESGYSALGRDLGWFQGEGMKRILTL